MKNFKSWILFLFCFFSITVFAQDNNEQYFKIISYNIWNGLSEGPDCRSRFVDWVKKQQPDVVALEELVGIDEKKLSELAAEYGHPYVAIVKEEAYPVGITSRKPIQVISKNLEGYWHGMLHVKTFNLDLIVAHLSPFEWKFRLKEARMITEYVEKNKLEHCMIMGDLNAYSPHDADEVETHALLKKNMLAWDKKYPQYGNMRGDKFDYSVLSEFLSHGFTDVIRLFVPVEKRMTYPAAFLDKLKWGDPVLKTKSERLDYILVSDKLVPDCVEAYVHNGEENEGISDHYPVSLIMRLP